MPRFSLRFIPKRISSKRHNKPWIKDESRKMLYLFLLSRVDRWKNSHDDDILNSIFLDLGNDLQDLLGIYGRNLLSVKLVTAVHQIIARTKCLQETQELSWKPSLLRDLLSGLLLKTPGAQACIHGFVDPSWHGHNTNVGCCELFLIIIDIWYNTFYYQ